MANGQRLGLILIVAAVTCLRVLAQERPSGEIEGRVTDSMHQPIPGAVIRLAGSAAGQMVRSDSNGEFVLSALDLGTYQVVVQMPGFTEKAGTVTLTPEVRRAYVEWTLDLRCDLGIGLRITTLEREILESDAVAVLRIETDRGRIGWSPHPNCEHRKRTYTVRILSIARATAPAADRLRPDQLIDVVGLAALEAQEYLLILKGLDNSRYFAYDDYYVLPVVAGRIASPDAESLSGLRVDEAVAMIRQRAAEAATRGTSR